MTSTHADGILPTNNEVFVFGSNYAGRHGKGAALVAKEQFGAAYGIGSGFMSAGSPKHSYAIPTKGHKLEVLSLGVIKTHVNCFIKFANKHSTMKFFVSRIGCGLAGYQDHQIAPLFKGCEDNVIFPEEWALFVAKNEIGCI